MSKGDGFNFFEVRLQLIETNMHVGERKTDIVKVGLSTANC